jgi:hypothetical protein
MGFPVCVVPTAPESAGDVLSIAWAPSRTMTGSKNRAHKRVEYVHGMSSASRMLSGLRAPRDELTAMVPGSLIIFHKRRSPHPFGLSRSGLHA